jgi:hypothetical protein
VEVNKKSGVEEVIMLERLISTTCVESWLNISSYKDKAALGAHGSSAAFKAFRKKLKDEGLPGAPMQLKFVKQAGGFARLWGGKRHDWHATNSDEVRYRIYFRRSLL